MKPCKILFAHSFDEIVKQSFFVRGWDYFKSGKIQSLRRTTSFQQNRGVPVKKAYFCPVIIISRLLMIQSMTGFGKASGELPGKKNQCRDQIPQQQTARPEPSSSTNLSRKRAGNAQPHCRPPATGQGGSQHPTGVRSGRPHSANQRSCF